MKIAQIATPMKGSSRSKVKPTLLASALLVSSAIQPAQAALTFTFNYLNPGQGFQDSTEGAARQSALNSAANMLGAYFINYTANLVYDVTSYSTDNSTLASAGSDMSLIPGTFQQTVVQAKIISNGVDDGNGADADGVINWNFFHLWGLSDNPASTELDFKSTAIHELLHSFGFSSNVSNGGKGLAGNAPGTADTWATFDKFLTDASGNRLISDAGVFDPSKVGALTAGTTNSAGVLFSGPNAIAANGGNGIPIFSPSPWVDGSSGSHLDDDSIITNQSIMNAAAHNSGLDTRTLGAIEIAIMKDLGYTNIVTPTAVPLPTGAWFMLSGLIGLLGLNRKKLA